MPQNRPKAVSKRVFLKAVRFVKDPNIVSWMKEYHAKIKVFMVLDDLELTQKIHHSIGRKIMEIFQTTAKMQQSQTVMAKTATTELQHKESVQDIQKTQINNEKLNQSNLESKTAKIDSQERMDQLIEQLNRSLDPFNTSLRFGFDNSSEDFYVSVVETKSNRMLRRFPLEEAEQILPKIQEVHGLLFDQKG